MNKINANSRAFVVFNTFVRELDDHKIIGGDVAYHSNGERITDGVGYAGGIIKKLLDMGYSKQNIILKNWVTLVNCHE